MTYACDNNTCAIEYHGGTSVDGANAGDCQRRVCVDGEPSPQLVADDTDPPGDQLVVLCSKIHNENNFILVMLFYHKFS